MKILVVAYDLPPSLRAQSIQVGRILNNLPGNYDLFVVTAGDKTCKIDSTFYPDLSDKFTDVIRIDFTRGLFAKIFTRLFGILYKVPDIFLFWHMRAFKKIIERWGKNNFDLILTFPYPFSSCLLGMALKNHFKVKWITFFSDPWAKNPHFGYNGLSKKINLYFESKVLDSVDRIVFPSQEMKNSYIARYNGIVDKAFVLEHSFDPGQYAKEAHSAGVAKLSMRYIGSFYSTRNAENIFVAIKYLRNTGDISGHNFLFEIVGDIPNRFISRHQALISEYGIGDMVKISPAVTYLESLRYMQMSDVLLLIDAPIPGSVYMPSKLADYIGAGRPIFALTPHDSASSRILSMAGGWIAKPDDVKDIKEKLGMIVAAYKKNTLNDFRPNKEAGRKFSITERSEFLSKVINK